MATKEEKAAAKAEKESMKALQKEAKKLKIDFDKDTTSSELQVLVDAAKAAADAQAAKASEGPTGHLTSSPNNDEAPAKTGTEDTPVPQAPPVVTDPSGDRVLNQHVTRGGDVHILVQRKDKFVVKNQHGIVNASFDDQAAAQHHMENLSRF